ncbi:hypothetical protein JW824_00265 [bacterium]|nr:hypothetical protein [bacterium]RQV99344.1 MAG: hypothetical protein EH221_00295 [bacterium]
MICSWTVLVFMILRVNSHSAERYQNFETAIYCRAYEVQQMADLNWLKERFDLMQKHVKVSKVYLETHRDLLIVEEETLNKAIRFFNDRGIETQGGITYTVNERNRFETFCYSNPEHRQKVKEIAEYTARFFDEIILDDFFFTNCKCELCIEAKGDKSWTQYRLELMDEAARELILKPAKAVNPDVKMIIKYPNWYEHFQGLGFNLETEPALFDGLYTGTETRDAVSSDQHLQPYLGYLIFRYFENLKPGGNLGGWVDTGGSSYMDRYAEQLWLTLFAKSPEITLFDFRQMQSPIRSASRAAWQDQETSFVFDDMIEPALNRDGSFSEEATFALAAGYSLEQVDGFLQDLGNPIGIKSYKPYHSTGEDFIHTYMGMIGIPMDLVPKFPTEENIIFLAETAKSDDAIVDKIKGQLMDGKTVIITSGLLKALQNRGIDDIVELEVTDRKAITKNFKIGFGGAQQAADLITIPQIQYLTNDSWEQLSVLDGPIGWPILHNASYAGGQLYVLTIPDNFADLYIFPDAALNRIRQTLMPEFYVRAEGPSLISLFVYDNDTFIVESFRDESADITLSLDSRFTTLHNIVSGEEMAPREQPGAQGFAFGTRGAGENRASFPVTIKPHSYLVFRAEE